MPIYLRGIERPIGRTVEYELIGSKSSQVVEIPFEFDTPGILGAGAEIYTPKVGQVFSYTVGWWVEILEPWDYSVNEVNLSVFCQGDDFENDELVKIPIWKDMLDPPYGAGHLKQIMEGEVSGTKMVVDETPLMAKLFDTAVPSTPPVLTSGKAVLSMGIIG